jgi:hypothetical protein
MAKLTSLVLLTLSFTAIILATPISSTTTTYPEVIPNPLLPSLASLNLTSADLYTMDYHTTLSLTSRSADSLESLLTPRFNLNCDGQKCQAADAVAFINYLASLGSRSCNMNFDNSLHQATLCSKSSHSPTVPPSKNFIRLTFFPPYSISQRKNNSASNLRESDVFMVFPLLRPPSLKRL